MLQENIFYSNHIKGSDTIFQIDHVGFNIGRDEIEVQSVDFEISHGEIGIAGGGIEICSAGFKKLKCWLKNIM